MEKLNNINNKKAIVILSGGMDSAICLHMAQKKWNKPEILALSYDYGQRHACELLLSQQRCLEHHIDRKVINLSFYKDIADNALINHNTSINNEKLNTLVVGRNGLMTMIAAITSSLSQDVHEIYTGVMELEVANSGYRDCSRNYFDKIQEIIRIDTHNERLSIITPLIHMTKLDSFQYAYDENILYDLLENTISCYEGIRGFGCKRCPACNLRNKAIRDFLDKYPDFCLPAIYHK